MTGLPELMLGLGIIGAVTGLIVVLALVLARKEEQATRVQLPVSSPERLRRAS